MTAATPSVAPGRRLALSGTAALIAVVALVSILSVAVAVWPDALTARSFKQTILDLGAWGVLGSIGLMVAHSFVPFPAEFVACANGVVYGPVWGTVITWSGAMLGAYAAFGLSRLFGRPVAERLIARNNWGELDQRVARDGWQPLLLSRFTPVIAFNMVNYAAGLSSVSWWTFTWTTGLGILPVTILMVLVGDNFNQIPWWTWALAFVLALSVWLVFRGSWKRRSEPGT